MTRGARELALLRLVAQGLAGPRLDSPAEAARRLLRGTVHLLAAEDLPWLRELLAPRQLAGAELREARLGLDAAVIQRAQRVADELLLGYRDRDSTLPRERDLNVFANRNGVPAPTIIYKGQVVATWKRPKKGSGAAAELTPLVPLSSAVLRRGAAEAAAISGRDST